jgi:hypothetical protein
MSREQARHGMKLYAYARLAAYAKLDTQAGHAVMAAIDALPNSGPVQISNTGYSMVLTESKPRGTRAYRHSLSA